MKLQQLLISLTAFALLVSVSACGGKEISDEEIFEKEFDSEILEAPSLEEEPAKKESVKKEEPTVKAELGEDIAKVEKKEEPKSAPVKKTAPKTTSSSYGSDPVNNVRMILRSGKPYAARTYLANLNFSTAKADKGELFHFKGVTYYLIAEHEKDNAKYLQVARDSFLSAHGETQKEKIKALSLFWLGMLYEKFYTDEASLQEGIYYLDKVINEYPRCRFANDATLYKALILKKLGKSEYVDYLLKVARGGYVDPHVYWKGIKKYEYATKTVERLLKDVDEKEIKQSEDEMAEEMGDSTSADEEEVVSEEETTTEATEESTTEDEFAEEETATETTETSEEEALTTEATETTEEEVMEETAETTTTEETTEVEEEAVAEETAKTTTTEETTSEETKSSESTNKTTESTETETAKEEEFF